MELGLFLAKEGIKLVIAYFIFKWMFKKEGVEYSPIKYVVIQFFFGFFAAVFAYLGKLNKDRDNEKASKVFYILTGVMVVINVLVLIGGFM